MKSARDAGARDLLEREVLSDALLDPSLAKWIAERVAPTRFADGRLGHLLGALAAAEPSLPPDLGLIADHLERRGALAVVGGVAMLSELRDLSPSAHLVEQHVGALRRRMLSDEEQELLGYAAANPGDDETRARLRVVQGEIERAGALRAIDLASAGFSGDRLRAVRGRPEVPSPLKGLLDPEPHLHVLLGKPKSGKTTFALHLARSWAHGLAPWPGASALPGSRALVISREQPVARVDATMRRFAEGSRSGDGWADRVAIVARDRDLAPEGTCLLTLDHAGLATLRAALEAARDGGDPFEFVVLDSLSRLKPPGIEERDNDSLTAWLDTIEAIAVECGAWIILIHHVGHTSDEGRKEARSAGRGASSIAAVAQVVWLFERVKANPRLRRVEIDGNAVLPQELHLEVDGKDAEPGSIHYFRPSDPLAGHDPHALLGEHAVSLSELARRLSGADRESGKSPPGSAMKLARELRSVWERAGLIETFEGKRGAVMMHLKRRPDA